MQNNKQNKKIPNKYSTQITSSPPVGGVHIGMQADGWSSGLSKVPITRASSSCFIRELRSWIYRCSCGGKCSTFPLWWEEPRRDRRLPVWQEAPAVSWLTAQLTLGIQPLLHHNMKPLLGCQQGAVSLKWMHRIFNVSASHCVLWALSAFSFTFCSQRWSIELFSFRGQQVRRH